MAYQEPKKRSIRLDDDVYAAVRKMPMSLNQFLRKALSADGAFQSQVERATSVPERDRKFNGPILKPSQRSK